MESSVPCTDPTSASSQARRARAHPTHRLSGTFERFTWARGPVRNLDEVVRLADGEIERLTREGPTAGRGPQSQDRAETIADPSARVDDQQGQRAQSTRRPRPENLWVTAPFWPRSSQSRRKMLNEWRAYLHLRPEQIEIDVYPGARTARALERPNPTLCRWSPIRILIVTPVARDEIFDRSVTPEVGPSPHVQCVFDRARRRLSSGLELIIVKRRELATHVQIEAGRQVRQGFCSSAARAASPRLTVNLLEEGTFSIHERPSARG